MEDIESVAGEAVGPSQLPGWHPERLEMIRMTATVQRYRLNLILSPRLVQRVSANLRDATIPVDSQRGHIVRNRYRFL
jgi:hypothetical protein